jgi:hypothetical protein
MRQTVLPFKLERTGETLTAHGDLALAVEYNHGLGLRAPTEAVLAAIRVKDSALAARYRRMMRHRGHKKAVPWPMRFC